MALVSPNVQKGRQSPSPVHPPRGLSAKTTPPSQCHGETQVTARSGYRPDLQCPRSRMDWLSGIPADALGPQPGRDRRRRADLLSAALRRLCLQIKHSTPASLRIAIGHLTPGEARARGALAHPRTRRDECFARRCCQTSNRLPASCLHTPTITNTRALVYLAAGSGPPS